MKKVLLSLAIVAIATLSANAQKSASKSSDLKFSIGADLGIPVGDYSSIAGFAYGGNVQVEYPAAENLGLTLNAGYVTFSGKNGYTLSGGLIPILVGARYYFDSKVYGSGQLGVSFSSTSGGGSAFTFAPGIGYKVSENFDLLFKYQSASSNGVDASFIGVRVAYVF